jgi:hypothetical protein
MTLFHSEHYITVERAVRKPVTKRGVFKLGAECTAAQVCLVAGAQACPQVEMHPTKRDMRGRDTGLESSVAEDQTCVMQISLYGSGVHRKLRCASTDQTISARAWAIQRP